MRTAMTLFAISMTVLGMDASAFSIESLAKHPSFVCSGTDLKNRAVTVQYKDSRSIIKIDGAVIADTSGWSLDSSIKDNPSADKAVFVNYLEKEEIRFANSGVLSMRLEIPAHELIYLMGPSCR